jgi:hypothetical protein
MVQSAGRIVEGTRAEFAESSDSWPAPLAWEAFHGLAGEVVRAIEPHSEADPAALLVEFVVAFGNLAGRKAHFIVEGRHHFGNLFVLVVGETSKARKGTSWGRISSVLGRVDPSLESRVRGGLSSGEGIIHALRDPSSKRNRNSAEEIVDEGASDKRLLIF